MSLRVRRLAGLLAAALLLLPAGAAAQVFLATRPAAEFSVGPLFLRARVSDTRGPVPVEVLWTLAVPPTRSALGLDQDLYLLWPGPLADGSAPAAPGGGGPAARPAPGPDPALAEYVRARGFAVVAEGRLPLLEEDLYPPPGAGPAERALGQAPFVVFVRQGQTPGATRPTATLVRIPWTPVLVNRIRLVKLRFTLEGLVRPIPGGWLERAVWGRRHVLSLGFNDVRDPAVFPLYVENRARLVRLADEPSQIVLTFAGADRLRIDEMVPRTAGRRPSDGEPNTEVVSLFLDASETGGPQELTVRFGYYSAWQTWMPVLVPLLFFVLGRATGPLIERLARRAGATVAARIQVGRPDSAARPREQGVVVPRETVARLLPGHTTLDEVLRLCGRDVAEEREALGAPGRRTLVYRGRRVLPHPGRRLGWLATVSHWEAEEHAVEIAVERDVVQDVQVRVRRTRLAGPDDG